MALIKYDKENFLNTLRPGITTLVVQAFKSKLEEKLNDIVKEVYAELEKELPTKLETIVKEVLGDDTIHVEINLKGK